MSKNDELRSKSVEELNKELLELRRAQFGLRMQMATGGWGQDQDILNRSEHVLAFSVSDTGIGIPQAEQAQMFGRFFRTSNARESGIEGSGLGLAITRGIVEAHGGSIGFDSLEGVGTTFRLTVPLSLASAA